MCPNHNRPLGLIYLAVVSWTVQAATASAADAGAGLASAPPEVSFVAPRGLEMAQTSSADAIAPWSWQIRPRGFVYDTYWAGAAEPRLGTQLVDESDGGPFLDSQVGGRVGMLRYGPADRPEGFQVDVLGVRSCGRIGMEISTSWRRTTATTSSEPMALGRTAGSSASTTSARMWATSFC